MNPILVALDVDTETRATELATTLADHVGGFKIGLELLSAAGPTVIETIAGMGKPVMVDAKLHDIPNTVSRAAAQLSRRGARWLTIHASGGETMMSAAVEAAAAAGETGILAVTVLTSIGEEDAALLGWETETMVGHLAARASAAGCEGVVCSPFEAPIVKAVAAELITVTPGIRMGGGERHDQQRVATPAEAMELGSDWLVVGRAITEAAEPAAAARSIAAEIGRVRT